MWGGFFRVSELGMQLYIGATLSVLLGTVLLCTLPHIQVANQQKNGKLDINAGP